MFKFMADSNNYEDRKVALNTINRDKGYLELSTAYTSDEGYETAIIDFNGVHPVERYSNKEKAIKGHSKWKKSVLILILKKLLS